MKELEYRDSLSKYRAELSARDSLLQELRDRDHESLATIDLQRKVGRAPPPTSLLYHESTDPGRPSTDPVRPSTDPVRPIL